MGQTFTGLADFSTKQVFMPHPEDKTATVMNPGGPSADPPPRSPRRTHVHPDWQEPDAQR